MPQKQKPQKKPDAIDTMLGDADKPAAKRIDGLDDNLNASITRLHLPKSPVESIDFENQSYAENTE
jgi:ABC-type Fe2+-enterobactin transport system substrate-binding protein